MGADPDSVAKVFILLHNDFIIDLYHTMWNICLYLCKNTHCIYQIHIFDTFYFDITRHIHIY